MAKEEQNFVEVIGLFQPHNGLPHHGDYVELVPILVSPTAGIMLFIQNSVLLHLRLLHIEYVHFW